MVNADVIFLLHPIEHLLDQFLQRPQLHLLKLLAHLFVQQIAFDQRLLDGAAQFVQRLLAVVHIVKHSSSGIRFAVGSQRAR